MQELHLDIVTSARISHTEYNQTTKLWTVAYSTPSGERIATAKHLVLAAGIGSQKPYMPTIADQQVYKGQSFHAYGFRNGDELKKQGVKVHSHSSRYCLDISPN